MHALLCLNTERLLSWLSTAYAVLIITQSLRVRIHCGPKCFHWEISKISITNAVVTISFQLNFRSSHGSFDELWLTIDTVDPVMVTVVREATSVALDIYILIKAKSHLRPSHFTGTIIADVVIRVLNKTSDEYWFLLKMNTTVEGDNLENMGGVRPGIMDYFLVKLKVASR